MKGRNETRFKIILIVGKKEELIKTLTTDGLTKGHCAYSFKFLMAMSFHDGTAYLLLHYV
jgi:hypothetical protein